MLIPMILEVLALDLERRAALFHPLRRPPSVSGHQTTEIPNPLTFGNDPGLSQHLAGELQNDHTFLPAFGIVASPEASRSTRFRHARYWVTYLPRTPPFIDAKSYSGRMSLAAMVARTRSPVYGFSFSNYRASCGAFVRCEVALPPHPAFGYT